MEEKDLELIDKLELNIKNQEDRFYYENWNTWILPVISLKYKDPIGTFLEMKNGYELNEFCNIIRKIKKSNNDTYSWITISPDHNDRKIELCQLAELEEFCEKWFCNIRYKEWCYVIEFGKNEKDPHIHVHALVVMKRMFSKNHSRDLKNYFFKYLNIKLIKLDYYLKNFKDVSIKMDKLNYMDNEKKGTHENWRDSIVNVGTFKNSPI